MKKLVMMVALLLVAALPAGAVEVKRVVSPGGIEAWLVEDHTNPILSMRFQFHGGSVADPAGKAGTADMLSGLLDEGAGELASAEFQRRLEDKAIRLRFDAGRDAFSGTLQTLTKHQGEAFDLLNLALTKPRFDEEPVARVRASMLASLARQLRDPESVAWRAWMAQAFPDHPYGTPADGTPESVKAITVADLRAFMAERFARDGLVIGVSGAITPQELAPLLDRAFAGLPAKAKPLDAEPTALAAPGKVFVETQEVPQSVVVFGLPGVARQDPDWYAAYVMNYILGGGGFASRLTEEVREKRGLAYGIGTSLNPLDFAPLLLGGTATQNARVAETLDVTRGVFRDMAQQGPTAEELKNAKTYLIGSFPLQLTSTGAIAGILVAMQRDNLGIDYLDHRSEYIEKVGIEDVQRVAKRLLDPANLMLVVVGNPQGLTGTTPLTRQAAAAE